MDMACARLKTLKDWEFSGPIFFFKKKTDGVSVSVVEKRVVEDQGVIFFNNKKKSGRCFFGPDV